MRLPVMNCGIATCLNRAIGMAGLSPAGLRPCRLLPDPYLRNYLIRLLPQVMTPIRTKGLRMAHNLTYPLKRTGRACPALCPGHVLLNRIPLGQPPSLRGLRRPSSDVVRPLPRYYCAVRLPMPVHHWIVSLDFPMRPWYSSDKGGHRISRFPCKVFPYAPRSPTARGPHMSRVNDMLGVAFRLTHIVSTPELTSISRLNTWPTRTLSTLQPWHYRHRRMTRGRCGSLHLDRMTLSFTIPCRSPGAFGSSVIFAILQGKRVSNL